VVPRKKAYTNSTSERISPGIPHHGISSPRSSCPDNSSPGDSFPGIDNSGVFSPGTSSCGRRSGHGITSHKRKSL